MTYANYGGYSYMGINRPALVRAFKDLRQSNWSARLGLSSHEGHGMRFVEPHGLIRAGQPGAAWTLASDQNQTWQEGSGLWNAQYGTYRPLEVYCSGQAMGANFPRRTAQQNAQHVCRVLELHGLHPFVDLDALTTPMQVVTIKLYPSTRLYDMTMDDTEEQGHRAVRIRQARASQDAAEVRHHEGRIESYIERYATALCDQGVMRSNQSTEIPTLMEQRAETIEQFMTTLQSERTYWHRFTEEEEARVLRQGASMAKERLAAMLRDVQDRIREMQFATMPNVS